MAFFKTIKTAARVLKPLPQVIAVAVAVAVAAAFVVAAVPVAFARSFELARLLVRHAEQVAALVRLQVVADVVPDVVASKQAARPDAPLAQRVTQQAGARPHKLGTLCLMPALVQEPALPASLQQQGVVKRAPNY